MANESTPDQRFAPIALWRAASRSRPQHSIDQAPALAELWRHPGEDARAPYSAPTTFHAAWPLAERLEALLRVRNNPAPYANA